jgi:hypothetical protein
MDQSKTCLGERTLSKIQHDWNIALNSYIANLSIIEGLDYVFIYCY